MRSNDFSTAVQTVPFISSADTRLLPGYGLLVRSCVASANTHSVEPSNVLCQVCPSFDPSFLVGVRSISFPSGSLRTIASPFFVYFPDEFTSVNSGYMTRNSPGAIVPESSMLFVLRSEAASSVYPSRSIEVAELFNSSTHSCPLSSPAGFVSNSLTMSPLSIGSEYFRLNPASRPILTPPTGMFPMTSPRPGTSLRAIPISW